MRIVLIASIVVWLSTDRAESILCFECRSDETPNCGTPFVSSVAAVSCDDFSVRPAVMCFKASYYVGGTYITARGCAPFDTETFPEGFQYGMAGTYWRGRHSFSLCDHDNCNEATRTRIPSLLAVALGILTASSM